MRLHTIIAAGLALFAMPALAQDGGEWAHFAGDIGATKYSPLDQINAETIDRLKVVWRAPATDPALLAEQPDLRLSNNWRNAPLVVNGVMYLSNQAGQVEARDPGSGAVLWRQKDFGPGPISTRNQASRALAFWQDGDKARIVSVRSPYLYVLDATTGALVDEFGQGGRVDLREDPDTIYSWNYPAPIVVGDVIVIGGQPIATGIADINKASLPGDVRGFDARSGELVWTFNTIPQEGQPGAETWHGDSWRQGGKTKVWNAFSADEELGYVYLPISAPSSDYDGRARPGDNLYSDSLVALDAKTGEMVWHYQTVHHDLWDYDLPYPPMLANIRVNGELRKAAIQVTKLGYVFAFDRASGEPLFPIEEVPVPQAIVEGEYTSPTQPRPVKPAPFERQDMNEDAPIDFTPELHEEAVEILNRYVHGPMYTPPTIAGGDDGKLGTLYLPGWVGGANWTGAALDPETGIAYIPSVTVPWISRYDYRRPPEDKLYLDGPQGLPLVKPPYGRITAIDMDSGDHLWMVPNGDGPRDHPLLKDLDLPPLGQSGRAAPLLTKSFLFMGEGDAVGLSLPRYSGGNMFRAYDKQTGDVAWEIDLGVGTTGPPISYTHEGRQYIVVAVGGIDHPAELVALALE
ncbi:outer membrane protein assembly factor BamB family protein [Croceicoccus mobilis]|uniref:Quinate dehydrogenase n=1 Tax=Croceicoccus mobilis TaxID=1703339 RepID=A0A916YX62_9SPHN|nr:PQQ-binding-like beta-propeller repeat protein [Croceicoccus mobilis]GGD65524.1 quinate dehydrogenase [Croceicoccus mobilis]